MNTEEKDSVELINLVRHIIVVLKQQGEIINGLMNPQKEILTLNELCEYTGKSKSTIYKQTANGSIPFYKNGKHLYFKRDEIDNWLRKSETAINRLYSNRTS